MSAPFWTNFLDKRMLELKENVQNEDGGINMCGAVDQMIAEGMERGVERGLAQGMERGLAQGTERGIKNLIEVCQELGTSYDNVQFQVEMKYNLSQEEAGKIYENSIGNRFGEEESYGRYRKMIAAGEVLVGVLLVMTACARSETSF